LRAVPLSGFDCASITLQCRFPPLLARLAEVVANACLLARRIEVSDDGNRSVALRFRYTIPEKFLLLLLKRAFAVGRSCPIRSCPLPDALALSVLLDIKLHILNARLSLPTLFMTSPGGRQARCIMKTLVPYTTEQVWILQRFDVVSGGFRTNPSFWKTDLWSRVFKSPSMAPVRDGHGRCTGRGKTGCAVDHFR
jgi:hypothetical protein